MNVDQILETFNRHQADCLLIGGMNFLPRHQPVLTFVLDETDRRPERVRFLREILKPRPPSSATLGRTAWRSKPGKTPPA